MTELNVDPAMSIALVRHSDQANVDFSSPHFANYQHATPLRSSKGRSTASALNCPLNFETSNGSMRPLLCCVFWPSDSKSTAAIHIDPQLIDGRPHFTPKDSWAKAEHVQHVSKNRLSKIQGGKSQYLPREVVTRIQTAVIRVIGAQSLLPKADVAQKEAAPDKEEVAELPAPAVDEA